MVSTPNTLKVRHDLPTADTAPAAERPPAVADGEVDPQFAGKDVRELQGMIERAFTLLDGAGASPLQAPLSIEPGQSSAGHAAGSALRTTTTFGRRLLKTLVGVAFAFVVGIVPLERLFTPVSTEAFVNAPIATLTAPSAGRLAANALPVGGAVRRDQILAIVIGDDGASRPIISPTAGAVWQVLVSPGDRVRAGQDLLSVVGCTAASVTAAVSEGVYDQLRPGTPARFNFYGDDRFYEGTVAGLLGHAAPAGDLAIPPSSLAADSFRVVVSLPDLASDTGCAVGRRGEVVFNPSPG
jgi:HlyD family secretion protein